MLIPQVGFYPGGVYVGGEDEMMCFEEIQEVFSFGLAGGTRLCRFEGGEEVQGLFY